MRIGSILINGVEWRNSTLVKDFEIIRETGGNFGTARMRVLYDPSTIGSDLIEPGQLLEIFTAGGEGGEPDQLFGQPLFGDPLFGESESVVAKFRGDIVLCEPKVMVIETISRLPVNVMLVEARNRMSILDEAQVEAAEYTTEDDDVIIADAFGSVAPTVDLTNVNMTTTLATFERHDESLRTMMERLAERTGAIMSMGPDTDFYWKLPASNPAPFGFSDNPDFVSTFPFDRDSFRASKEWRTPANSVTVLGQVGTGGTRIRTTPPRTNATSISLYGTKGRTVVDPQITSVAEANLRGDVELDKDSMPQWSGTLVTRFEGLDVGMLLPIDCTDSLNFSGDFVITRITERWLNRNITESTIEWGVYRPDTAALLRAIAEAARHPGAVLPGTPAPGTVGTGTIIPGSVTGGTGGSIASATITNLNVGNAAIEEANIANLAVAEAKIQNAAISTAKIQLLAVTNALINDLAAGKINTGDLLVGGSGKVGQITVYDSGNTAFGWIGKNGSDYGAWFAQIRAGGTSWSNARFRVANGGAVSMELVDGDNLELISSSNSRKVLINNGGMSVLNSGDLGKKSSILDQWMFVIDSSGYRADMISAGSESRIEVQSSGGQVLGFKADSTGSYVSFATLGPVIRSGAGDPEGVVTAPPGSIYLRNNPASSVTALYVKYTGTGNTGWVAK